MSITYKQVRDQALKLIDEYSSRGAVVTAQSKIGDILLKIQGMVNDTIYDLASTAAKIPATFYIAHYPIKGSLSEDTSTIKQHMPGTDFSIAMAGAKSTFFETTGPAEIIIEESADNGATYTEIEAITVAASVTDFTEYKRLIAPSADTNLVRLRFTGDYVYLFRNYVLYGVSFPSEDAVQQHRSWFSYDVPDDFLEINYVEVEREARQFLPYTNYRLSPDKKIYFNKYDSPINLICRYWRKPNLLIFTGDSETDDALTIDLEDVAAMLIPYNVAGEILKSEKQITEGTILINQYEQKKSQLPLGNNDYSASVLNVTGW